jgi:hypothetical protein
MCSCKGTYLQGIQLLVFIFFLGGAAQTVGAPCMTETAYCFERRVHVMRFDLLAASQCDQLPTSPRLPVVDSLPQLCHHHGGC